MNFGCIYDLLIILYIFLDTIMEFCITFVAWKKFQYHTALPGAAKKE